FVQEVCFMLPPLLGLLLDCAKKTDQSVVSISLGALVHLIEVGGHQFSDSDWDTLLKSIRDASYTTQPMELLNSLGFDNSKNHLMGTRDPELNMGDSPSQRTVDTGKLDSHKIDRGDNGNFFGQTSPHNDSESPGKRPNSSVLRDGYQNPETHSNLEESAGLPSPRGQKTVEGGELQRTQTFGQRIMGNMMDNLLLRSLTSKSRNRPSDALIPSSPEKV
ncbi:hypothetical protein AQUCO_211100001v1, partial [Aquilegia coerulea]